MEAVSSSHFDTKKMYYFLMTTSKWGGSIRELMDLLFTSHELSTCSVRGKKTQRPALPKKRWHLLSSMSLIQIIKNKFILFKHIFNLL